jgi:hypothetical protein
MELPVGKQSPEFWRRHIKAMDEFEGSQAAYAATHGLSVSKLVYYRDKFKKADGFARVVEKVMPARSSPQLPDPRWLSQLIREFLR